MEGRPREVDSGEFVMSYPVVPGRPAAARKGARNALVVLALSIGLMMWVVGTPGMMSRLVGLLAISAAVLSGVAYWVSSQSAREQPAQRRPQPSSVYPASTEVSAGSPGLIDLRQKEQAFVPATSGRAGAAAMESARLPRDRADQASFGTPASRVHGPPRFGPGSRAQRREWVLPPRVVQSGVACDAAWVGDLTIRAASVVGPGHRCEEPAGPRQDAYAVAVDPAGSYFVAAVADGVSSSRYSEVGAHEAAAAAARLILARLSESGATGIDAREVYAHAAQQMSARAAAQYWDDADVCAALITAVVPATSDPGRRRLAHLAWVGDVSAWILREGHWACVAGDQKSDGVLATNEVYNALPFGAGAVESVRVVLNPADVLVLVTDGVGDGLAALPELRDYLASHWRAPIGISAFLDDVGYDAQRFLDDRTAVSIWVADPAAESVGGLR
jgi:serine/threonine protein phosphatase PrpC